MISRQDYACNISYPFILTLFCFIHYLKFFSFVFQISVLAAIPFWLPPTLLLVVWVSTRLSFSLRFHLDLQAFSLDRKLVWCGSTNHYFTVEVIATSDNQTVLCFACKRIRILAVTQGHTGLCAPLRFALAEVCAGWSTLAISTITTKRTHLIRLTYKLKRQAEAYDPSTSKMFHLKVKGCPKLSFPSPFSP